MRKPVSILLLTAAVLAVACLPSFGAAANPIAKLGLGHITSIASSKDLAVDANGKVTPPAAQVNTTIAAVAFDASGKVVDITIDTAQTKVNFDKDLQVTSDLKAPQLTKVELGDGYGMRKVSSIKKEWNEQIAELEKWMVGKTVAQIKSLKLKNSSTGAPDDPELTSRVTITVEDYIAAVEEAYKTAVAVPAGAVKLGLGHEVSIAKSKAASAEVNNVMAATLFDKDGKVVRTIIDTAQTKVPYGKDGKVTADKNAEVPSKKERGDDYGMRKVSSIKKEWNEQIVELEKWMVGKTASQIKALKLKNSTTGAPDVPELTSFVTVTVEDYIASVAESYKNAR